MVFNLPKSEKELPPTAASLKKNSNSTSKNASKTLITSLVSLEEFNQTLMPKISPPSSMMLLKVSNYTLPSSRTVDLKPKNFLIYKLPKSRSKDSNPSDVSNTLLPSLDLSVTLPTNLETILSPSTKPSSTSSTSSTNSQAFSTIAASPPLPG